MDLSNNVSQDYFPLPPYSKFNWHTSKRRRKSKKEACHDKLMILYLHVAKRVSLATGSARQPKGSSLSCMKSESPEREKRSRSGGSTDQA